MQRGIWFVVVIMLMATITAFAAVDKVSIRNLPVRGGSNDPVFVPQVAPDRGAIWNSSLDSVGTRYLAGYTYYEYQHNGTAGRMIYTDANGIVHVVWMRGLTPSLTGARHIYYNYWDPQEGQFGIRTGGEPVGSLVDVHTRAGYTSLAGLPDGWIFPVFHEIAGSDPNAHVTAGIDYSPGLGAFSTSGPTPLQGPGYLLEAIWPKIAIGRDSALHVVSCENPYQGTAGDPQRIYYSRGYPTWDQDGFGFGIEWDNVDGNNQYLEIDTVMVIAPLIVTSKVSDRVAILWSKSRDDLTEIDPGPTQYNNDLYMLMSEDGGHNWAPERNITSFIYPDEDCASQDTVVCDKDTFRLYTDVAGIFDLEDVLHVAFTTPYYWSLEGYISATWAQIWHWDERYEEFSNMVYGEFDSTVWTSQPLDAGAWQRHVQRPCLTLDRQTGYLYCSYHYYDPFQTSEAGWPQGDIYVTFSRNCGRSWSEGINVTSTDGGVAAPQGASLSEKDITASEFITYQGGVGYLDVFYLLDLDAGSIVQEEGAATNNPLFFRRIPVDDLTWELHDPFLPIHCDSTGFPGSVVALDPEGIAPCGVNAVNEHYSALRPESFKLYQNYPNPFNPTTNIQFDLVRDARVTLKVFNVMGQAVATLYDGQMLNAGVRTVEFDASNLASGIYVYRIEADGVSASMKMVLMK